MSNNEQELLLAAFHALRSYQYGNNATDLAEEIAAKIEEFLQHTDPLIPYLRGEKK
jgi:hypothetical protein